MGDMETTVDDVTTDVDTDIDTTDDSGDTDEGVALLNKYKIDPANFTQEDLVATLARLERAETAKRQDKKKKESSEPAVKFLTEADLERRDFLKANPELSDYTKELGDYQKKGLSLDEAKTLILNSDKARVNREKVNSLGLSDGEAGAKKDSYTQEELAKMKPEQAQKIWALASKGQVKVR